MKKLLLNSTILAGLVAGAVSLWIVANPVSVHAASSSARCRDGSTVECSASGSDCIGVDSTSSMSGYCLCVSLSDGSTTALDFCVDGENPPILD